MIPALLVGSGLVGGSALGGSIAAEVIPETPTPGTPLPDRAIELVGVDGTVWSLACGGPVIAGTSPAVWGTAPVAVSENQRIGAPGGFITNVRHTARDLVIPLDLRPKDESLEELIGRLSRSVDAVRGDVDLVVGRPDGTRRRITARYLQGLELVAISRRNARTTTAALSLRAHWPYWSSVVPEVVVVSPPPSVWDTEIPSGFDGILAFNADLPFNGGIVGSNFFDDPTIAFDGAVAFDGEASQTIITTLSNQGDVTAWPTWEVTGPCGTISATNLTTGKTWELDAGLAAGQTLIVTTRPGEAAARINDQLALSQLADGASLWSLPPGDSTVVLQFADNLPGSSYRLSWSQEYLTC